MSKKKSTSPIGGKRGCLCEDSTYHIDCCKGETINQGIGATESQTVSQVNNTNQPRTIVRSNG